jgi:microcin C transport system substrate-binding protein
MEADLSRTVKEQSSFYFFKTPADFATDTQGLTWEDGSDLPSFADPKAKKGGTLNVWSPDFPGTFRYVGPDSNGAFRSFLLDYVTLGIVRIYPNSPGRIGPELATSWAVDTGRKTVYFHLDPDAKWSDGVPFTTDDIVFSWYLFRSPILNDPWLNDYFNKTFTALTVYDAHTFSVTLKELRPDIVAKVGDPDAAMAPMPRHFFKDFGPGWEQKYNWRVTPTTGAYTIREEDIRRTSSITLSHVKDWWAQDRPFARGRFNPHRIHLTVIHDPDKAFEAFVHGDLDVFILTTNLWYNKLPDSHPSVASGFTVKATFYNRIPPPDFGLWLNTAKSFLGNQDVRLGIEYATDFNLVCKQYFRGDAVVQKTVSDGYGWDPNPAVKPRPFDPSKAREYFAKAGFTQQGPDGVLMTANGARLSFTITTIYRQYQDILVILKQQALQAGLEFNVEVLDQTTGFEKEDQKKDEIALTAFNRPVDMYPRYWETLDGANAYDVPYLADGSPNPARKIKVSTNNLYSLADYDLDQMIAQYDKTATMDEVKVLSAKLEQRVYDDAVWVNGWKLPFFRVGYRPWVKWPADFNPEQSLDMYKFWLMWIDPDEQKADIAAKAEGRSLPPQILTFDKYKEP